MKRIFSPLVIILTFLISCHRSIVQEAPVKVSSPESEDKSGAFYSGVYRNLFLENGHSRKEIFARNQTAFQQLFYGDSATQAFYFETGRNENGPMA